MWHCMPFVCIPIYYVDVMISTLQKRLQDALLSLLGPSSSFRIVSHIGRDSFAQAPPRDGGASSRKLPPYFFQGKRHLIPEDGHRGASRWPTRQGACPGG